MFSIRWVSSSSESGISRNCEDFFELTWDFGLRVASSSDSEESKRLFGLKTKPFNVKLHIVLYVTDARFNMFEN